MKTLYFDCFSGISGDMTIGALLDLGIDFEYLRTEIDKLGVDGFELRLDRVVRAGISAARFTVTIDGGPSEGHSHSPAHPHASDHAHDQSRDHGPDPDARDPGRHAHGHADSKPRPHHHRKASEIIRMIRQSGLTVGARRRAAAIFEKLAIAEGRVHDLPPEDVEFHEVGAIDSIVDVVGAAVGLDALGVDRFLCSAINVGGGFIHCQHGVYPTPAPATANLLAAATVYSKHVEKELVTPTGAAILAATVDRFGPLDGLTIAKVGYGAGSADLGAFPNCLRLFLGTSVGTSVPTGKPPVDEVTAIEASIDDMSPEELAWAADKLMASGALDVVTIPVVMKKGRSAHMLQVLTAPGDEQRISRVIFEETSTIGVRMNPMSRLLLDREVVPVQTSLGSIRVKVSRLEGREVTVSPEYEDCARVAREFDRPFHDVREQALEAYRRTRENGGANDNG